MKLTTPPAPDADWADHIAYAKAATSQIRNEVERLETPGLQLIVSWATSIGALSVDSLICFGCARIHTSFAEKVENEDGSVSREYIDLWESR